MKPLAHTPNYAVHSATLVTLGPQARKTTGFASVTDEDLGVVSGGGVVVADGRIEAAGSRAQCADALREVASRAGSQFEEVNAAGRVLMPGLVDAHTHALFAGDRVADFEALAAGETPPLGIRYTVEQTRKCDLDGLVVLGARHLAIMLSHGTTTAEMKSGYTLTAQGEALMLRAMAALDARDDLPHVVPTFCGAHALPPEFRDYDAFVEELCERILPRVADLGIAKFADAFCETNYFTPEQSRRFLQACAQRGMRLRLHADELSGSGGGALAAELGCTSADHLNFIGNGGARRLAAAGTIAVLCPATTEYLDLERWAPARMLIDNGVPVALATDFNPGTSPCCSLQTVAHLARRRLKLSAAETIAGVTTQAARSLGLEGRAGALLPGYRADLALFEFSDFRHFGYYYGTNGLESVAIGV